MYLAGRGVEPNVAEGTKWMRRAAEAGDARAEFNIAALYVQGTGVPQDDNEAAKWMRKAAEHGLAAGQFGLGSLYASGRGVPKNLTESVKWYRRAVDQGDPAAMNNLAFLLATSSDSGLRDPKEAIALAQNAFEIEPDNPAFLDTLGTAYFQAGQQIKAAEAERRALKLQPDNPSYKKALEKYDPAVH